MEDKITTTECAPEMVDEDVTTVTNGESGKSFDYNDAGKAYELLLPKLKAIPDDRVNGVRISAVNAVINALKVAHAYQKDMASFYGIFLKESFDPDEYTNIPDRALALWYADIQLRHFTQQEELHVLLDQAKPLHAKMVRSAKYLWEADTELGDVISNICSGRSHLDIADDFVSLTKLFEDNWAFAHGRCNISGDDLNVARTLGIRLIDAMHGGVKSEVREMQDLRDRAGTYLRMGVSKVRAAAGFVFYEDPDELERYPSLFAGRGPRRTEKEDEEKAAEETETSAGTGVDLPVAVTAQGPPVTSPFPQASS